MKSYEFNLQQLDRVANALGDLLPRVTFVGGCATALLVDEAAYFGVRETEDVDVIVDVATLVEYYRFGQKLRDLKFREDPDGVICRWLFEDEVMNLKLDVMPIDEEILGFSNRWYEGAINEADSITLPSGTVIRVVSPPYFIATKFEAFKGRGKGDFFSHDLEDIVFVLENRSRFILELAKCSDEVKSYFASQAISLLNDDFLNVLPGLLNNSESTGPVVDTLKIMKSWSAEEA